MSGHLVEELQNVQVFDPPGPDFLDEPTSPPYEAVVF